MSKQDDRCLIISANFKRKYGFTIVMVTHNLNIAEMATTVIKMNSGKVTEIYTNKIQKTAYEDWLVIIC